MIGSSVSIKGIEDATYLDLLIKYFDFWYPDNGFKWMGRGNENTKRIVDLAVLNNKSLRGNNLASATSPITKHVPTAREIMDHLENTLNSFHQIKYWDCTHEALDDNGYLRGCQWAESLGKREWQKKIFTWANEIAPDNHLFYCDYFRTGKKWKAAFEMVSDWIEQGIPIHGISVQLHSNMKPSLLGKYATLNIPEASHWMNRFKRLGLILHVPEIVVWQPAVSLDIEKLRGKSNLYKELVRKGAGDFLLSVGDVEALQAKVYKQILDACKSAKADMVGFWSAFDTYQWNWVGNRANGGLWDNNYSPKKSFASVF